MPTDRVALWCAAFLRAVATGMAGVLLGLYLVGLGPPPPTGPPPPRGRC